MSLELRPKMSPDIIAGGGIGGYDGDAAKAYAESRHGVDGPLIDKHIYSVLQVYAPNAKCVDVGIGAGAVALQAIHAGAESVYGVDNSTPMLEQARTAIQNAESIGEIPPQSIHLTKGSVEALPTGARFSDLTLSVNVACNLQSTSDQISKNIFLPHFQEMARTTTKDGIIFITAPTTFGEVFTSGTAMNEAGKKQKQEVLQDIAKTLLELKEKMSIADNQTRIQTMRQIIGSLGDVNRATFVQRGNEFKLVYNGVHLPEELVINNLVIPESELKIGESVWRKLAGSATTNGLVVENYYHPRVEYAAAIQQAGLRIVDGDEPIHEIMTEDELKAYNATLPLHRQLGEEYLKHSPFDIYVLQKAA